MALANTVDSIVDIRLLPGGAGSLSEDFLLNIGEIFEVGDEGYPNEEAEKSYMPPGMAPGAADEQVPVGKPLGATTISQAANRLLNEPSLLRNSIESLTITQPDIYGSEGQTQDRAGRETGPVTWLTISTIPDRIQQRVESNDLTSSFDNSVNTLEPTDLNPQGLFLKTGDSTVQRAESFHEPHQVDNIIALAEATGMTVVGKYLPEEADGIDSPLNLETKSKIYDHARTISEGVLQSHNYTRQGNTDAVEEHPDDDLSLFVRDMYRPNVVGKASSSIEQTVGGQSSGEADRITSPGRKATVVNLNRAMIENFTVHVSDVNAIPGDIRQSVEDVLLEILNHANI